MNDSMIQELVINFHMTEKCNFRCEYCYAHWTTESELHEKKSQDVYTFLERLAKYFLSENYIQKITKYSQVRLNFAGGEPLLLGDKFVNIYLHAHKLGFKTSIITNGYFLSNSMIEKIFPITSVLGISVDSSNQKSLIIIGRSDSKGNTLSNNRLLEICESFREKNKNGLLKINTVVTRKNHLEDMNELIKKINPDKWKILKSLAVHEKIIQLIPTQEEFLGYIKNHSEHLKKISIEDNEDMQSSYLMLNPAGRFYQNKKEGFDYQYSQSIMNVGVEKALNEIDFDINAFKKRYSDKI